MREEMKHTKKLGNKGFSLIELIIVIAIMAILIGIVGTQVVPYIEKSKQAKDKQVLSGFLTNATTAFANNADALNDTAEYTFVIGGAASSDTALEKVKSEFYELAGYDPASVALADVISKMGSKAGKSISSITIARDANGKVTVTTQVSETKYDKVFEELSST
ncbi:type IV pilin protein [[Clostridium] polysaccharolyticum]|uniref:Prepilin-type N-terminal cleavage/methylation domain-containing protein n=1 Tax=[Clostridium] polysaccharolyticum TaxID=29364 RepID=A0A1H9ZR91_9FIRM|nr:type II secretion system protein [[Clostridium] polysaccharolyticum]SES84226.1 prepilin-type N-terminal cleavage/methylation domain-containing protein [[Clostridium] polysaccharolyticum]